MAIRQTDSGLNSKVEESHGQADGIVSVIGSSAICISGHAFQLFVAQKEIFFAFLYSELE